MGGNAFWNFRRQGGVKTWKPSVVGYGYFLELPNAGLLMVVGGTWVNFAGYVLLASQSPYPIILYYILWPIVDRMKVKNDHRSKFEALIFFFFQASSFQLLKLENLLR